MKRKNNVEPLDMEWMELLEEARMMGIPKEDITLFFAQNMQLTLKRNRNETSWENVG